MLNEDYIKDLFNHRDDESQDWFEGSDQAEHWTNPMDENQDWLEPSDALLGNIENVIYQKPKRKGFFWTLLGLTMVLLFSSYSWFTLNGNGANNYSSILIANIFTSPQEFQFSSSSIVVNSVNKELLVKENTFSNQATKGASKRASNTDAQKTKNNKQEKVLNGKANPETPNTLASNTLYTDQNFKDTKIRSSASKIAPVNQMKQKSFRRNAILADKGLGVLSSKKEGHVRNSLITESLASLLALSVNDKDEVHFNSNKIIPHLSDKGHNAFSFGVGYTFWNFTLNQNYLAALDPADFTYKHGTGYQMHMSYDKKIAHRLSWVTSLSLEKITYQSGHNSAVNYELANEDINLQNRFSLNMASPLGFLGSEVTVQRINDDITQNQNDLMLDLHNSHQNYNVDLNSAVAFNIVDRNRFQAALQMGLGLNHLFGLQNELTEVNITGNDFKSISTSISSNQENIIATRPYANIGMRLNKRINRNFDLTLEYAYKRDLRAIYSNADFSTRLSRHLLQTSARYSF